jgi:hypothetical protein
MRRRSGPLAQLNAHLSSRSSKSIIQRYDAVRLVDANGPSFVLINNVLFIRARGLSQL